MARDDEKATVDLSIIKRHHKSISNTSVACEKKMMPRMINRRDVNTCVSNATVHIQPQADVAKKVLDIINMTVHIQTVCCTSIF